jgi:hypothetical protein
MTTGDQVSEASAGRAALLRSVRLPAAMLIAATVALGALAPASAHATRLDVASDRVALGAYEQYMNSLLSGVTAAQARDAAFEATVDRRCAGVLEPLDALPSGKISRPALVDLGEELRDDVAVRFDTQAAGAFTRFASRLHGLRWSSTTTAKTIATLIAAIRASLALQPSALCADARAFVSAPLLVPAGTSRFLAAYRPAASAVRSRLSAFLLVLERFQTTSESAVIRTIDRLVTRYEALSSADQNDWGTAIVNVLGRRAPS